MTKPAILATLLLLTLLPGAAWAGCPQRVRARLPWVSATQARSACRQAGFAGHEPAILRCALVLKGFTRDGSHADPLSECQRSPALWKSTADLYELYEKNLGDGTEVAND